MTERDRIMEAFRNCITEPKCKDCPWIECEWLDNRKIEIPADLALAVMRVLTLDALPLGWLREKMQKPCVTGANPFGYVLAEWLEEQEAR